MISQDITTNEFLLKVNNLTLLDLSSPSNPRILSNMVKTMNPVRTAVSELGGQKQVSYLLSLQGLNLHKQAIHNWTCKGEIPHKYRNYVAELVKVYSYLLSDAPAFLACIRKEGVLFKGQVDFPNKPLKEWVDAQGGIPALVRYANTQIAEYNKSVRDKNNQLNKWTYVMIHNWLRRGRISDDFRDQMETNFNCPREVMGPEDKKQPYGVAKPITPEDILGA